MRATAIARPAITRHAGMPVPMPRRSATGSRRSENGYVRMDTQTGAMSTCEEHGGQLVCKLAADEREAYQDQIEHLQNSLKALENRVAALENKRSRRQRFPPRRNSKRAWATWSVSSGGFMGVVKDMEEETTMAAPSAECSCRARPEALRTRGIRAWFCPRP